MQTTLEREFNPARADCGLQGTATSPSSTATMHYIRFERHLPKPPGWQRSPDAEM